MSFIIRLQIRCESALVADGGAVVLRPEHLLQGVERFHSFADRLRERGRIVRRNHELLEIDRIVGVLATIEYVHAGYRKRAGICSPKVPVERQPMRTRRCPCSGH
jgi:hypothetical protein